MSFVRLVSLVSLVSLVIFMRFVSLEVIRYVLMFLFAGGSETGTSSDLIHSKDRFCGTALGFCKETTTGNCGAQLGAVTTFTKPFIVGVITNENEAAATKSNRGFNLLYSQQPCLSAG